MWSYISNQGLKNVLRKKNQHINHYKVLNLVGQGCPGFLMEQEAPLSYPILTLGTGYPKISQLGY